LGDALKHCAGGILFKNGQVLLGKRSPNREFYPNVWDIIGGHSQDGKTLEQTLVRELEEEIRITPTSFRKIGMLTEPQPQRYGEYAFHIYVILEWVGKGPIIQGNEHTEIRWFPVKETVRLQLAHPGYKELFTNLEK